jgi:predicted ester cyclase
MSEQNKDLVRRLIEGFAGPNLNVIDQLLAPDFVDHDLPPDQRPDREDYKRYLSKDRDAFSNFGITIEDQIAEGDKVVTRLTWGGTHDKGEFMGMAPTDTTDEEVKVTAIFIHRIDGGEVKEEWSASDTLERLRPSSAAPEPGWSGETGPG